MKSLLAAHSESERTAYMKLVAYAAGFDNELGPHEVHLLRRMCMQLALGPRVRGEIFGAVITPKDEARTALINLAGSDLKYSLLVDVCVMARANGFLREAEEREVREMARLLQVNDSDLELILNLSLAIHEALTMPPDVARRKVSEEIATAGETLPTTAMAVTAALWGTSGVEGSAS